MMAKIVFLDAGTVGELDLSPLTAFGEVCVYDTTPEDKVLERAIGADILITNKVKIMRREIDALPDLRLVCIAATGMNNVDLDYAREKGITVKNVSGYSTYSVAQTTFALLLSLYQKLSYYDDYVKSGEYGRSGVFTHHGIPFSEISGKTWGIIGLGAIGKRVARIAGEFGADVIYYSTSGKNVNSEFRQVTLKELLSDSDIVSIHAPLNKDTEHLIAYEQLEMMKKSAVLINVGRGGIVKEPDLVKALQLGLISGAALDVYEKEPLEPDSLLMSAEIADRILLLPHIAWASVEARKRLIDGVCENIKLSGY